MKRGKILQTTDLVIGKRYFLDDVSNTTAEYAGRDEDSDPQFKNLEGEVNYGANDDGFIGFIDIAQTWGEVVED